MALDESQLRDAYEALASGGLSTEQQSYLQGQINSAGGGAQAAPMPLDMGQATGDVSPNDPTTLNEGQPIIPGEPPIEGSLPPQGNTEPFPLPSRSIKGEDVPGQFALPREAQQDAQAGVDITTGVDPMMRFALTFAPTAADAGELLRRYGYPEVRQNSRGGLEFLNDATNRWTSVDEVGISMGDVASAVGIAPTALLDMLGNVAGGATGPLSPIGRTAGTGAGTFAGETLRMHWARAKGIYPTLSDDDIKTNARDKAITAMEYGGAFEMVGQVAKRILRPTGGLSLDELKALSTRVENVDGDIHRIESVTGQPFTSTLGQRADDPTTLSLQALISQHRKLNTALINARKRGYSQLNTYWDNFTQNLRESTASPMEALRKFTQRPIDAAQAKSAEAQAVAASAMKDLPILDEPFTGKQAGGLIASIQNARKLKLDSAWSRVERMSNERIVGQLPEDANIVSDVQIPANGDLKRAVTGVLAEASANPFPQVKGKLLSYLPGELFDMVARRGEGGKIVKGEAIDLAHLRRALDYLDNTASAAPAGSDLTRLNALRGALRSARDKQLGGTKLGRAIHVAEERQRRFNSTMRRGISKDYLVQDELGRYVLDDPVSIFRGIFRENDGASANELMAMAKGDDQLIQQFRNSLFALYKKEASHGGLPVRALHDSFMDRHHKVIEAIFGDEAGQFERFGQAADVVEKQNRKLASVLKSVSKSYPGAFQGQRMSPETLADAFFGKSNSPLGRGGGMDATTVRRLTAILGKESPEALAAWQRNVSDELFKRVTSLAKGASNQRGDFVSTLLSQYIGKYGDQLGELYGGVLPTYKANLETIRNLAVQLERKGTSKKDPGARLLSAWVRVATRYFSREGLTQTAAGVTSKEIANNAFFRLITDPSYLKEAIALRNHPLSDPRVHQFLASMGALEVARDEHTGTLDTESP